MTELSIFKNDCNGVFELNGVDENSATYALGWTLSKSPNLLEVFVQTCISDDIKPDFDLVVIELQKSGKDNGFTDMEIKQQSEFHIIVEAKKGWFLPSKKQLAKYVERFQQERCYYNFGTQILITMSAASPEFAENRQATELDGYELKHKSWRCLLQMIKHAREKSTSFEEKLWLRELKTHIQGYDLMRSPKDNMTYCVVLSGKDLNKDTKYTWVDVIQKDNCYFHPVAGNGWPATPPNYIAFRRLGKLMSVHHVDSYEVIDNLQAMNKNWPKTTSEHFVYKLGSAMKPEKDLKNGKLYPNQRIWCALDTLLSGAFKTIAEARDETKRRLNGG